MLDSRYVHLHEALGLGAMWLRADAKIMLPTAPAPTRPAPVVRQIQLAKKTPPKPTAPEPPKPMPVVQPIYSCEHYVQQLSGSLKPAKVMALSVCASPADVMAGKLFSGTDGELLQKMLHAIHLTLDDVHISCWLKDLPDFSPKPPIETIIAATPRVQAEWQLCGAHALLLMGDFFHRPEVQAEVAQIHGNAPVFTIAHPQRILSNPQLKRGTWETLQKLEQAIQ